MATVRKCVMHSSPTRTPLSEHQLHRHMTLATLLHIPIECDRKQKGCQSSLRRRVFNNEATVGKNTLMDLLSSSSLFDVKEEHQEDGHQEASFRKPRNDETGNLHSGTKGSKSGSSNKKSRRVVSKVAVAPGVRFRFLKRPWRPMLTAIPEGRLMDHY